MSTENVTYAFQVAATNGNGFSVFFRDPNFVTFRVTGKRTVTAGAFVLRSKKAGAAANRKFNDNILYAIRKA
jgi:hypothetical protein